MRAGLNYSSQGGNAYCPGHGGAAGHPLGRLGAECDTYAELAFTQEVYNKANNKFSIHTLVAYGTQEGNWDRQGNVWQGVGNGGGAWNGQRTSFREGWVDYEMPSGITLWAGKRYYGRKDVHITDYIYLNDQGTGFGLENIPVGNLGKVSFALLKQQTDSQNNYPGDWGHNAEVNSYKLDARWMGIPMWSDATLDVVLVYAWQNLSVDQKQSPNNLTGHDHMNNGFLTLVEWTQGNLLGGFNKLSFTYGLDGFQYIGKIVGGNHGADTVQPYQNRGNSIRLLDWGVIEQSKWNLGYSLMFTHYSADKKDGVANWGARWVGASGNDFNIVLRPAYKWSDYTSTVVEFGYASLSNHEKPNWNYDGFERSYNVDKDRVSGTKLTIAQQWSPATHFWARPSIRLFATWMSGGMLNHNVTGYRKANHQYIYGAQVEAWW